eukprot:gene5184-30632_t
MTQSCSEVAGQSIMFRPRVTMLLAATLMGSSISNVAGDDCDCTAATSVCEVKNSDSGHLTWTGETFSSVCHLECNLGAGMYSAEAWPACNTICDGRADHTLCPTLDKSVCTTSPAVAKLCSAFCGCPGGTLASEITTTPTSTTVTTAATTAEDESGADAPGQATCKGKVDPPLTCGGFPPIICRLDLYFQIAQEMRAACPVLCDSCPVATKMETAATSTTATAAATGASTESLCTDDEACGILLDDDPGLCDHPEMRDSIRAACPVRQTSTSTSISTTTTPLDTKLLVGSTVMVIAGKYKTWFGEVYSFSTTGRSAKIELSSGVLTGFLQLNQLVRVAPTVTSTTVSTTTISTTTSTTESSTTRTQTSTTRTSTTVTSITTTTATSTTGTTTTADYQKEGKCNGKADPSTCALLGQHECTASAENVWASYFRNLCPADCVNMGDFCNDALLGQAIQQSCPATCGTCKPCVDLAACAIIGESTCTDRVLGLAVSRSCPIMCNSCGIRIADPTTMTITTTTATTTTTPFSVQGPPGLCRDKADPSVCDVIDASMCTHPDIGERISLICPVVCDSCE